MDIALKKIELIEWLARLQDESTIQKIEGLRKSSVKELYEKSTPGTIDEIQAKLDRAELDIESGNVHSQEEVERFFKSKFNK